MTRMGRTVYRRGGGGSSEEWKEDTARVFPKAPHLTYVVIQEGRHASVHQHVLRDNRVPTVIIPMRASWFVFLDEGPRSRTAGYHNSIPADRVLFVSSAIPGPHMGDIGISFHQMPRHLVFVILPPRQRASGVSGRDGGINTNAGQERENTEWPEQEYREEDKDLLFDSMGQQIFDHATNLAQWIEDVPAFPTIVGIEAWDLYYPLPDSETWQQRFEASFDYLVDLSLSGQSGKLPDEPHINRPRFVTLEEWREEITPDEWEIVSGLDLD